ncbi:MAG: hypothetical protein WDN30_13990 [Pararobbsia sp.]
MPKTPDYFDFLPEAIDRVLAQARLQRELDEAERVREREQHYRLLAEAIPQLVWTTGPDGSVDYVSKQFLDYTGAYAYRCARRRLGALAGPSGGPRRDPGRVAGGGRRP